MDIPNLANPVKWISAGSEAMKKAAGAKDKEWYEKVGIFFSAFWDEMKKVEGEEQTASREADKKAAESVDVTMEGAKKAFALDASVQEPDRALFEEVVAVPVGKFALLEADDQIQGKLALKKLESAMAGTKSEMKYEEVASLMAVGLMSFQELKKHYVTEAALAEALKEFSTLSGKSKYPVGKLLSSLHTFKMGSKDGLKFLNAIGVEASVGDALSIVGISGAGSATNAGKLLSSIGKSPMQNEAEVVAFVKEKIFPNSSDVAAIVRAMNRLATNTLNTDETKESLLAKLIFLIADSDYDRLVKALVGSTGKTVE